MAESDEAKTITPMTAKELFDAVNTLNTCDVDKPVKVRNRRSDGFFRAVFSVSVEDGHLVLEVY